MVLLAAAPHVDLPSHDGTYTGVLNIKIIVPTKRSRVMIKIYTAWTSQQQLIRKAHMNADTINRFAWNYCVFISFPFIIIIKSVYDAVAFYQ